MFPHLSDALSMMFGNGPRHSVPHAAKILRVDAERLYAALALLEAAGLVAVHAARTPEETWRVSGAEDDVPLTDLLARIEALVSEGKLPKHVIDTSLD